MSFHYSIYAMPLFVAAAMTLGLALYAFPRRKEPLALVFCLMTAGLTWWSLFYALNISGDNLQTQYLFNRIKYVGVMSVPPLWLILTLIYTQRQAFLTRRNILLIFVPQTIFLLIVLTDSWTHLWWTRVWESEFAGLPAMDTDHGVMYYTHIVFSYGYIIWGLVLYGQFYRNAQRMYRYQTGLMIVGAVLPLLASVITQLELSPLPWGLDSFLFSLSSILLAIAIFRYRLLDIVPVAHQTTLEQIPDGVLVIDAEHRIVDVNPAALRFLRQPTEQLIGQPFKTAIELPEIRDTFLRIAQADPELAQDFEARINGQVISISSTTFKNRTQETLGQIILMRDISDQVAAQHELETSYRRTEMERARLDLIIKTTRDPILMLDAEDQVLASNPAARHILQLEDACQFPDPMQELLRQARANREITKAEMELGEQSFHVAIAPTPGLNPGGQGSGLVVTMHDISTFKQLAQLKDEFVHTVSHDLRSPLTSILGYVQVAQLKTIPKAQYVDVLERIETAAWRMSNLINDLLDLAALEAGVVHDAEPVALDLLVRAAIEELDGAAMAKNITIKYDPNPEPMVRVDPRLMTQVWRNLIGNAIKYTPKGIVTIDVEATDEFAVGRVIDTGMGISQSDIPHIFDKFYRAKKPYSEGVEGTGLGLALVKSIVERHDGRVWVESELGVGSTFTFMLPLCQDHSATPAAG